MIYFLKISNDINLNAHIYFKNPYKFNVKVIVLLNANFIRKIKVI